MKLEPKVEDSTWVHPQPEVILPSLIPLVFERFLPILTLWLSPNSRPNSLGTLRMVVGMLGQRRLCIAHLGPFSGAEETQIPKTNVRVEDKKVL